MLLEAVRRLGATLLDTLRARLEILSLDIREDRIRFLSLLGLGAAGLFLIALGTILGLIWFILAFREEHRLLVMGILTLSLTLSGFAIVVTLAWRLRHLPGPFAGTMAELRRDREVLAGGGGSA